MQNFNILNMLCNVCHSLSIKFVEILKVPGYVADAIQNSLMKVDTVSSVRSVLSPLLNAIFLNIHKRN